MFSYKSFGIKKQKKNEKEQFWLLFINQIIQNNQHHPYCFRLRIPNSQDASPGTNEAVHNRANQEAPVDGSGALHSANAGSGPGAEPCACRDASRAKRTGVTAYAEFGY